MISNKNSSDWSRYIRKYFIYNYVAHVKCHVKLINFPLQLMINIGNMAGNTFLNLFLLGLVEGPGAHF